MGDYSFLCRPRRHTGARCYLTTVCPSVSHTHRVVLLKYDSTIQIADGLQKAKNYYYTHHPESYFYEWIVGNTLTYISWLLCMGSQWSNNNSAGISLDVWLLCDQTGEFTVCICVWGGGDQISPVADFLCFPDCCSRAENSPSLSCEEVWLSLSWWNISLWRIKPDFYWANNRIGYACQHLTVQTLENNWSKSRYWSSCMLIQVTPFVFQG